MTDATKLPFEIPATLKGCKVNLVAVGAHVRAYTWLGVIKRDTTTVFVPLGCLAPTPQDACDRLGELVAETQRAVLDGSYPLN